MWSGNKHRTAQQQSISATPLSAYATLSPFVFFHFLKILASMLMRFSLSLSLSLLWWHTRPLLSSPLFCFFYFFCCSSVLLLLFFLSSSFTSSFFLFYFFFFSSSAHMASKPDTAVPWAAAARPSTRPSAHTITPTTTAPPPPPPPYSFNFTFFLYSFFISFFFFIDF